MTDMDTQPQTNWAPFEDMLPDLADLADLADPVLDLDHDPDQDRPGPLQDEVPVYGWRILCTIDSKGERWYRWGMTGDPELQETVATFERVKFVLQANEYDANVHG